VAVLVSWSDITNERFNDLEGCQRGMSFENQLDFDLLLLCGEMAVASNNENPVDVLEERFFPIREAVAILRVSQVCDGVHLLSECEHILSPFRGKSTVVYSEFGKPKMREGYIDSYAWDESWQLLALVLIDFIADLQDLLDRRYEWDETLQVGAEFGAVLNGEEDICLCFLWKAAPTMPC